ncbi:potassium/proton antiporter [bacterium]|nr:MAG: potassium/proton antiporter [bacterium]
MLDIDSLLLIGSILVLASIGIARVSDNLGVPALVLFLAIGMLAGSEGPGGIYFDNAHLSRNIGIVALIFILFTGGLETNWPQVRPVLWGAMSLATLGVLLTASAVALFAVYVLHLPLIQGLLLGAIISSTDAAAVFSVLRSKSIALKGNLAPLLELESGSNDPMAVFLTLALLEYGSGDGHSVAGLLGIFLLQMGLGGISGFVVGKLFAFMANRIQPSSQGIYPVFSVAFAVLAYAFTATLGGSGFLAVYVVGIIAGNSEFIHKRSTKRFFEGLAWLSQIAMFLTLGLLVFPSYLAPVAATGLLVSAFLMFVARPAGVLVSLAAAKQSWREKIFVSWVGLRGAVPIILATFPLIAGFSGSGQLFNLVFFIVLTSALLQGWSIPLVARFLGVEAPQSRRQAPTVEFEGTRESSMDTIDFIVPFNAAIAGRPIVELGLPQNSLIVLLTRGNKFLVPNGGTVLETGDAVVVLACKDDIAKIRGIFAQQRVESEET